MGQMNRAQALDSIMNLVGDKDVVISTTGLTSRYLYQKYDSPQHFYNPGAMGLVSSIGLGVSLHYNEGYVFIIDGDGSLLMNFASILSIGMSNTINLVHIILNNASYGSCSGEPTNVNKINLKEYAKLSGYRNVRTLNNINQIGNLKELINHNGPSFFIIEIDVIEQRNYDRPLNLIDIKERFIQFINTIKKDNEIQKFKL
jgi:phosphonopyruvate decarboxylase